MKEYIVCLKQDVDLDAFWQEIETSGNISAMVPARPVQIANNRDFTPRQCHYYLTDQEVLLLRQDERVAGVNVPVEQNPLVKIAHTRVNQTRNNFQKTTSSAGSFVNWGLVRNSALTNVYGTSASSTIGYGYFLDGTGVDIVIIDSGIQANHPEFQKVNEAISRVQEINWFERAGLNPALQPAGFYTDYDGHGTHVAGIAAGKTYGWAKNANIFSIKLNGLKGPADPGTGLTWDQTVDVLLGWHQNKMNPASIWYTGRPTIINMSFAYLAPGVVNIYTISGGTYRLYNNWTGGGWYQPNYGMIFAPFTYPVLPVRYTDVDDAVDTLIENGMTVCIAANNQGLKIDRPTGIDYYNRIITVQSSIYNDYGNAWYYMQGSSPYSSDAFIVGNMDSTVRLDGQDQKAVSSSAGPGVDIFAAGTNIMSACSNINVDGGQAYEWDKANFKQLNISGTSMASPQIAGIAACYLQQNLGASPAQVKSWAINNATYTIYNPSSALGNDYTNSRSQWGGNAPVAYSLTQGPLLKQSYTWNPVANISIKTDAATWQAVEKIWVKTNANTWKQVY